MAGLGLGLYRSDKNVKENRRPARDVLTALKKLPVESWKYKNGVEDGGEHVGPMAQDFKRAFKTGGDGKSIHVVDAFGVVMKALQELDDKLEKSKSERGDDDRSALKKAAQERRERREVKRKGATKKTSIPSDKEVRNKVARERGILEKKAA
jgi:hypothetical protein